MSEQSQEEEKLSELAERADKVMLRIRTVFPFDFFPKEIVIDQNKVSIVSSVFFQAEQVQSINIRDILNVVVGTSAFFASLQIQAKFKMEEPLVIDYLRKKEALMAQRIIQGLLVLSSEKVDAQKIRPSKLREKVEEIGTAHV